MNAIPSSSLGTVTCRLDISVRGERCVISSSLDSVSAFVTSNVPDCQNLDPAKKIIWNHKHCNTFGMSCQKLVICFYINIFSTSWMEQGLIQIYVQLYLTLFWVHFHLNENKYNTSMN